MQLYEKLMREVTLKITGRQYDGESGEDAIAFMTEAQLAKRGENMF